MSEAVGLGVSAKEIMTTDVATASPDQSVVEIARELTRRNISGLPVIDDAGALVGVISEYDVITKRGDLVADIMSRGVISMTEDADARQIAEIMGLHGIHRVPVMRDGAVIGVISRSDMVRLFVMARWHCPTCGFDDRGFEPPARCRQCGEAAIQLEWEPANG